MADHAASRQPAAFPEDRVIEPAAPAALMVVLIDRLPAWILPPYGATWVAMPALCELAARGVVFERLTATGDDPHCTLADMLAVDPDGPAVRGLLPAAAARGWSTAVVTDDPALDTVEAWRPFGAGSETAVRHVAAVAQADVARDLEHTSIARLFAAAAELVAAGRHELVIVHVTSLGRTWDAPLEFREAYVDPEDPPPPAGALVPEFALGADADPDLVVGIRHVFAGQLTLLDRCLGALVGAVHARAGTATSEPRPALAPAGLTLLVAGLRGLGLGLHGRVGGTGLPAFGELSHLPAVLVDAAGRMAAQRYSGLVAPRDLGATLVDMLGGPTARTATAEPHAGLEAISLEQLFAAWRSMPRDRIITTAAGGCAVTTPAWRLVATGREPPRLFSLPDDFFELCDVADRCPDVAAELGRLLAEAAGGRGGRCWTAPLTSQAVRGLE